MSNPTPQQNAAPTEADRIAKKALQEISERWCIGTANDTGCLESIQRAITAAVAEETKQLRIANAELADLWNARAAEALKLTSHLQTANEETKRLREALQVLAEGNVPADRDSGESELGAVMRYAKSALLPPTEEKK